MANEPDNRKVVPGGDVKFAESTMRPDVVLEEVVRSPEEAEVVPQRSFVDEALHRYIEYVASTRGPRMVDKFDPAQVISLVGYFAFDRDLKIEPRQVPKQEFQKMLRTIPDVAFLLDHSDLDEMLPDRSDLINPPAQLKSLGYVPPGDVTAFNHFQQITSKQVLIPACFLPLVIEDGERYHRFLSDGGKRTYYQSDHRDTEGSVRVPRDYDALGLSAENLKRFVEQSGERNISGFMKQLVNLHEELQPISFFPNVVATTLYNRLNTYHPELTV